MPRPNRQRQLYTEQHVAKRIAMEREARDWTYEGLAKRVTDAGCAIQPSAIYKIEKSDPPRRITVTELVAFAQVFGLSVEEMLADPATRFSAQAIRLVERLNVLEREYVEAKTRTVLLTKESNRVFDELQALAEDSRALEVIRKQVAVTFEEQGPDYQRDILEHITGRWEQ